jgi:putative ABC transport system permease protein
MRIYDMLILAVSTLWQQKVRTLLTVLGVVFGSFVLAASLSINHGVQKTIDRFVQQNDALRKIDVHPDWSAVDTGAEGATLPEVAGKMSDACAAAQSPPRARRAVPRRRTQGTADRRGAEKP